MRKLRKLLLIIAAFMAPLFIQYNIATADVGPGPHFSATVDGNGFYFATGEAYPKQIQISGYDTRNKKLYLSLEFEKTVGVSATDYNYIVEVFDGSGVEIGNNGTLTTSVNVVDDPTGMDAKNIEIALSNDLPVDHRIVVTVISFTP